MSILVGMRLHTHHQGDRHGEQQSQGGIPHIAGQSQQSDQPSADAIGKGRAIRDQRLIVGNQLLQIRQGVVAVNGITDPVEAARAMDTRCVLLQATSEATR